CAAPRPRTMPFASVVFPAPRLPISNTTPRRGNSPASRSPNAMVSSSEVVRKIGTLLHGVGKELENVGGDETLFAERVRADLACQSVQVDGGGDGFVELARELREEAG